MTIHRPDFASVTLANDLRKLEEDYIRLQHRQSRPAMRHLNSDEHARLFVGFINQAALTRSRLIDGRITFDTALVVAGMLEAAFHVLRRALSGLAHQVSE